MNNSGLLPLRLPWFALCLTGLWTAMPAHAVDPLTTPIKPDNIDPAATAQWVDGRETPIVPADAKDSGRQAQWILWTDKTAPGHSGMVFGASKTAGPRHLRVGLKQAVTVGSVLVRGGGSVSVLKPEAAFPGDLADESQWIVAERIKDAGVSRDEGSRDQYVLWILPRATATRAIRFTHVAAVTDKDYAGWLGGAYVSPLRAANLATQGVAVASSSDKNARKINNENIDPTWEQWSNISLKTGERPEIVSEKSPEWVMLNWAAPVKIRGLATVFAGFAEAEVQVYAGPTDVHPREAPENGWKTVGKFSGLKNRYPTALGCDWLDLGQERTTRALRLLITKGLNDGGHPHTQNHPKGGKRVWVGELLALSPVEGELKNAILPTVEQREKPPIAVKFEIPEPGWVTLVIEDSSGKRVRNLISDTFYEKGAGVAWWDGSDDLGRDPSAAKHGLYYIPTQFVAPGSYRVRGLWRKQVDVHYEMGVYTAGHTPWGTADKSGGWLSNHTAPSGALFVPAVPDENGGAARPGVLIGSYVSEGTAGLAWVDMDGRKWRGQNWVGGTWTGAPHLARDAGPKAIADSYAYVAAAWSAPGEPKKKVTLGEIRLTALTAGQDKPIVKFTFTPTPTESGSVWWENQIGGLAVRDGIAIVSLPTSNKLVFVDARAGKVVAEAALEAPQALAFDAQGRLVAISGTRLVRFASIADPAKLPAPEALVSGLQEPRGLAIDAAGNLYVADRGNAHQVKVFAPDGKPIRTIGKPGAPAAGPYDPLHMNNPRGLAIDARNQLWVAEEDLQPKRVSVWNIADGSLIKAFYGPSEYGGGGSIDPVDKSKFYYYGMEFKLDWARGTDTLTHVYYRRTKDDLKLAFRAGIPQSAIYVGNRRYFTNAFNSSPTGGHGSAFIFAERNGIAVPVAGAGRANDWEVLKEPALASAWPAGTDPKANQHGDKAAFFLWSDLNADGQVQAGELQMRRAVNGGVIVGRDLSFVISRLAGQATQLIPQKMQGDVPVYDLAAAKVLVEDVQPPPSSGGDQALVANDGWTIHTTAPKPYKGSAIGGARNGAAVWSYPSLWPGLHASHEAPVPDRPGMVIGHTRLLGDIIAPNPREPLFLINGNHGPVYAFTIDGLFVAQIFQDMRVGRPWGMPTAQRGMLLNNVTPSDENFWPGVTQTPDGKVYVIAGRPNCIVRVDGLETVQRIAPFELRVTENDLNRARDYYVRAEASRQAAQGRGVLAVAIRSAAPKVDGQVEDWSSAAWADIDKRGTAAYFNSSSQPYNVTGAVAVSGDRLYAAWRTGDKDLLKNAGDVPNALFKTGGALDLMIGASASADPKRNGPVEGDVRLLITQVGGKTRAALYRAVVAAKDKQPVPFSSPGRTITFDRVDDVSDQVKLAGKDGNFELSIPLATVGMKPAAGQVIQGDIGILRGTGSVTTQRVYWTNKATAIVADVPSEAELRPGLWGRFEFVAESGK